MCIVNSYTIPDSSQRPVCCVEESICTGVVLSPEPFSFHHSPQGFGNVQMRGIWRDVKQEESPFFPNRAHESDNLIPVYTGIIEHNKRLFVDPEGILIKKFEDLFGINRLTGTEPFKVIITINHPKNIEPFCSFRWYIYILLGELPSLWNITFGTNMRFISVKEVDFSLSIECFKFLQFLGLVGIELQRGYSLWTFSYTSISCAKADKKRLKVKSLASLPQVFCHASLAERTLWRSESIALRTASSSEQSMMGLRPCPGRVDRPLSPSDSNRFTQPLTLCAVISVCNPTCTELKPSDLSNTQRQRIRKQWESPLRKPNVSSFRSDSVNLNILIFIYIYFLYDAKIRQFFYM